MSDPVARPDAPDVDQRFLGVACGLGAAAIWGGSSVVSRHLVVSQFDPVELTFLRYVACFPVALAIYVFWFPRLRSSLSWGKLVVLLLLAGPPFHFIVIVGYKFASAGLGALLIAGLLAVFTVAGGIVLQRGMPAARAALCTALVLSGLALLVFENFQLQSAVNLVSAAGIGIFTLAAALWALLNHLLTRWQVDPLALTVELSLWSPLFLPVYFAVPTTHPTNVRIADVALQLVYHGWFVALGATFLYFMSVRKLGAVSAAIMLALAPALSVIFGSIALGEPLSLTIVAGVCLVLTGFVASMQSR
ncbi:MAG: DMT family transporter [Hyphomicrobiaceae bacterium]